MIGSLVFLGVVIAIYAYIIRVAMHHKPVLSVGKHTFRYWWDRILHVGK